ncbi:hypothetical protein AB1M95_19660 [Sulfitobacter sp. LCG007]
MSDHLIIAVHGIGEQKAGETIDAITGAAIAEIPPHERHPVAIERDVIDLVENGFNADERQADLFPVHLRRVRKAVPGDTDDALFLEVFWADKSTAPKGPLRTAFDLLRVVLGLGYLAMENVESNRGLPAVGIVHVFTWVFYGLIAPVNAALLIGVVILLMDLFPGDVVGDYISVPTFYLFHGAVTLWVGVYYWITARTYLVRIFGRGMTGFGVAILLVAASVPFGLTTPDGFCPARPTIGDGRFLPDLDCYTAGLIHGLNFSWTIAVALAVLNYPASWLSRPRETPADGIGGHRVIYPAICAAMIIFWIVSSSTLWLLARTIIVWAEGVTGAPEQGGLFFNLFEYNLGSAMKTLSINAACLLLVIAGAVILLIARRSVRQTLYARPDIVGRVMLNPGLRVLLGLSLAIIFMVQLALVTLAVDPMAFTAEVRDWFTGGLEEWNKVFTLGLLALGILIYQLSDYLAGGLGVVRDIVTYAIQDRCRWRAKTAERQGNFRERNDINNRFRLVMKYGLETVTPKYVTVLSHSQGTVIATQMLQDAEVKALLEQYGNPKVTLVTMGSPVTHIYRRYFKEFFQVSVTRMPAGTRWFNIFRTDDFVGTQIDADTGVMANLPVPPGGHTGYFTDYWVWQRLLDDVGLRVFPDSPTPLSR